MSDFACRLQRALSRKHGSIHQCALALGLPAGTMCCWVGGVRRPKLSRLAVVSEYLEVSIDWLATGREWPAPPPESEMQVRLGRLAEINKRMVKRWQAGTEPRFGDAVKLIKRAPISADWLIRGQAFAVTLEARKGNPERWARELVAARVRQMARGSLASEMLRIAAEIA